MKNILIALAFVAVILGSNACAKKSCPTCPAPAAGYVESSK